MQHVVIYTDGACKGNPGDGGYGIVILYGESEDQVIEDSGWVKSTTNNRMELFAVIHALESLVDPTEVDLYSDSKYVVSAINERWLENWKFSGWKTSTGKAVKNIRLWLRLDHLLQKHKVSFHWVKGHNNNEWNERCDHLAVSAINDNAKIVYDEDLIVV